MIAGIHAKFEYDKFMHHRAVVRGGQRDLLACGDGEFGRRKSELRHIDFQIGGWTGLTTARESHGQGKYKYQKYQGFIHGFLFADFQIRTSLLNLSDIINGNIYLPDSSFSVYTQVAEISLFLV